MADSAETVLQRVALMDVVLTLPFALPIVAPAVVQALVWLDGALGIVFVVTELGGALVQARVLLR